MGEAFIYGRSGGKPSFDVPSYSGNHTVFGDAKKGYMVCYTSGTLDVLSAMNVDVFMVNGGNGGSGVNSTGYSFNYSGAGGPGGRTKTVRQLAVLGPVGIQIGAGGAAGRYNGSPAYVGGKGGQTFFGAETPGDNGALASGLPNGSPGGTGGTAGNAGTASTSRPGVDGASDGANGNASGTSPGTPGQGQGSTTRAFEGDHPEFYAMLFSGAGGSGSVRSSVRGYGGDGGGGNGGLGLATESFVLPEAGAVNTGGGGGGGGTFYYSSESYWYPSAGAAGGSGICIVRWGDWTEGGVIPPASPKEVNFYDYDGKLLYSYTLAEAQALSALPTEPDHSNDTIPLTFQAWNYTLEQVKALTEKADIGATYIPTDGKTHLKIRIAAEGRMVVPLYFSQTVTNGVTIDWGDGSSTQKLTGTGNRNTTHTYSSVGDYDITLAVESDCVLGLGINSSSYCVLGATGNDGRVYCNMLQEVNVGERVNSIEGYAFQYCNSLASITIPNSVNSIGTYAFRNCHSLASITIPNSVNSIETYAFRNCYSLASITIPNSVNSIEGYAFQYCNSLASITIPNSVNSIETYAFGGCNSLASITIPNSVNSIGTYAFQYCYSLASITIPNSVNSIETYAFGGCHSLASITIPNSVNSIETYAFGDCYGMAIYDFSTHTSVPTLASTNAFDGIPSDCIMKIPSALFATWETATNWSTYASNMMAV